MVEENIICIGCPLGCKTILRIGDRRKVLKVLGYKCNQGRGYVLGEYRNPVRTLTATVRTEKGPRPLLPVRTNRPILKTKLKETTLALAPLRAKPPVKMGEVVLPNLLNSGVDVVATDYLFE
jgi:CxxC motif-containing protein